MLVLVPRPREVVIATLDGVKDAVPADVAWFPQKEPGEQAGEFGDAGGGEAVLVIRVELHVRRTISGETFVSFIVQFLFRSF